MASASVSASKVGVASVPDNPSDVRVASVPVSFTEGGVAPTLAMNPFYIKTKLFAQY